MPTTMTSPPEMARAGTSAAAPDQDFIAFAQEVFQRARSGDAETLARLLEKACRQT
jgi:N-acetylglucosamine kinase-like BadF-type ATPase